MKNKLIKNIAACMLSLSMVLSMSACGHQHTWVDATSTSPKTCSEGGETEGEALGYSRADQADAVMAAEQQHLETAAGEETESESVSDYFATARLTRQQSRDEELRLLEEAAGAVDASQETIDSAMQSIAAMATRSMQEAKIENLLMKDFDDCVVYISGDGITVSVPVPVEGLNDAAVARITDTITGETDYTASQITLIEIKNESAG